MKRARVIVGVVSFVAIATTSDAQISQSGTPTPLPTIATPFRFGPIGDVGPIGNAPGALPPLLAVTPLRLTLAGDVVPMGQGFPGCEALGNPSGNSVQAFAIQRVTYLRLTPALTLHGFSSAGCPIDSAAGGGVTYAIPLLASGHTSQWLVASAGAYGQPSIGGFRSANVFTTAGVDFVQQRQGGSAWWVGVGAASRAPQGVRVRIGTMF